MQKPVRSTDASKTIGLLFNSGVLKVSNAASYVEQLLGK